MLLLKSNCFFNSFQCGVTNQHILIKHFSVLKSNFIYFTTITKQVHTLILSISTYIFKEEVHLPLSKPPTMISLQHIILLLTV